MTCIVALKHAGRIYMGADSAGVGGYSLSVRADPKIFRVGNVLIGFTTSFRMGQLLGHTLAIPRHHADTEPFAFMCGPFIDAVRACLKAGGYAKKENDVESCGTFLVGYAGAIYQIDSDYQVGISVWPYDAVGCGQDLALGSLHTSAQFAPELATPSARVRMALEAAEQFSAGVRRPFLQMEIE